MFVDFISTDYKSHKYTYKKQGYVSRSRHLSEVLDKPKPPYYAVIFTSVRTAGDNGYGEAANRMIELAEQQPGYLGAESAREDVGITVSYWADLESIKNWKANTEYREAQKTGRKLWYESFKVRISKVERDYGI